MAQEILILGRPHGTPKSEPRKIVAGPSTDYAGVKSQFKALCAAGKHDEFEQIELCYVSGERRQNLDTVFPESKPEPQPEISKRKKKNEDSN
jgi:hypothetical protein